jgi:aminopeptidase YwaD
MTSDRNARGSPAKPRNCCSYWILALLVLGPLVACSLPPDPTIARRVAEVQEARLRADIDALTEQGPRSPDNLGGTHAAVEYLKSELTRAGYVVTEERVGPGVAAEGGEYHFVNVIAELPGSAPGAPILELGAHYDTVSRSVGADDNASGVAGLLEIARVLSGDQLQNTVRFCFFGLEEHGMFGSAYHAAQVVERNEPVEGIFVFEMIGYATDQPDTQEAPARIPLIVWPPTVGNFITVVGNISSGGLGNRFEKAADRYVPDLKYYSVNRIGGFFGDSARSDHSQYWSRGLKGIMLTDTANFRNPHYHQPTDTPETLNFAFMRAVTQAALAATLEWAR